MEKQLEYIKWLEGMIKKCKEDIEMRISASAFELALNKFKEINNIK